MRLNLRSAALVTLFLLHLAPLSAEPILRGYFVEGLPKTALSKPLAADKSLVLAHILNTDSKAIVPGKYKIGVEIENGHKTRKYALSPKETIEAGAIKTFRMAIPVSEAEKTNAYFRVFGVFNGQTTKSQKRSFLEGAHQGGKTGLRSLYTEAEPENKRLDKEVPFENEKTAKKIAAQEKAAEARFAEVCKKQAAKTEPKRVKAENKEAKTARKIEWAEFKRLRTIDEELVIYVIKTGDTLKSVAQKYYGDASKERKIADLNFIERASSIRVGEEIIVDVKPLGKTEPTGSTSAKASNKGAKTHTIKKGDTIEKVAKKYLGSSDKDTIKSILKLNPGLKPNKLAVGDVIALPNKGGKA